MKRAEKLLIKFEKAKAKLDKKLQNGEITKDTYHKKFSFICKILRTVNLLNKLEAWGKI